ncbi:GCC2 and protein GCC3 [Toxoplasma gondii VAND]|uniref:GCC2 and protein GCC3 n=1 Tax=Toxoplasma gondii VAND TaxID=933077 RepID=A0A086Q377_TOXGO|nr:GCC2 and protein GCC3 [Toxoplasma gondii VAND]
MVGVQLRLKRSPQGVFLSLALLVLGSSPFSQAASGGNASLCNAGQFGNPPNCMPCPVDHYGPAEGMSECMSCPLQATTLGLTGAASIGACSCSKGYYLNAQLATCASCPLPATRFYCPGGVTADNIETTCKGLDAVSQGGWWIALPATDAPVVYEACSVRGACVGGCGECRDGHSGPLCAMCISGWSRDFFTIVSHCSECPNQLKLAALHGGTLLGLAVFLFVCYFCTNHSLHGKLRGEGDEERSRFVPAMKMLMTFLSVWGVYGLQADLRETWAESTEGDSAVQASEDEAAAIDAFRGSPAYFENYVSAARSVLLISVAGQKVDCWFSGKQLSPLYVYTLVAFLVPVAVLFFLFAAFNLVFLTRRNRPPASKRLFLIVTGTSWRDVFGQKLTAAFGQILSAFLLFWVPGATTYFIAALQCMSLASGERVQVFDTTVSCGGRSYSNATQVALPGMFLWTFGCPIFFFLAMLFHVRSLEERRWLLIFAFLNDFYRPKFFWWESLRLLFVSTLICVAVSPFPIGRPSFLTILLALYGSVFAVARPYVEETRPPWVLIQKSKKGKGLKIGRSLQLRELLMWIDLALAFQVDSVRISLTSGLRRRAMEVLVVVLFSLGQLLLVVWVLWELGRAIRRHFRRKKRQAEKEDFSGEQDLLPVVDLDRDDSEEMLSHKFLLRDEQFFADAIRLSPFPEEALAQTVTFMQAENLSASDVYAAADFLFEQGHIEPQGQTLYVTVPRIATMYSDLTYDISTTDEFREEMKKLLRRVAAKLKLHNLVGARLAVAKQIRTNCRIVGGKGAGARRRRSRRRTETGDETQWEKLLGGETSADVQLRWLHMRMHPDDASSARTRAEFALIFPSAKPVCFQEDLNPPEEPSEKAEPGLFERLGNAIFGEETSEEPHLPPHLQDPLNVRLHPIPATDII